jgi:hypothetical protein
MTEEKRIVYATVKLVIKESADIHEITAEADYNFEHPDILDTEWMETEEKS